MITIPIRIIQLVIIQLALVQFVFSQGERQFSPEQIEHCLREADTLLSNVDTPSLLMKAYYETKPMEPAVVIDTSHELGAKVQAMFDPQQQELFDEGCRSFWFDMAKVRENTSCGKDLLPYLSVYNRDRQTYLANHQTLNDRLEMHELCVTVRCKQAYDRKQARLNQAKLNGGVSV